MPKDTPSMAKNKIKRCLIAILDPQPSPDEVRRLWEHFESSCAYCGVVIERQSRQGHMDHAVSSASGGRNSIYSHVLACGRCNGDEKREEAWESFLARKCSNELLGARRYRLEQWLAKSDPKPRYSDDVCCHAQGIIDAALETFDTAVLEMKEL